MSLDFVLKWYNRIPKPHRKLPLVIYKGKAYSPNKVLEEVKKGTQLGQELQAVLETGKFTKEETYEKLAKIRLKMLLKNLPPEVGIATFSGKVYTRDELLKMIEEGEDVGRELIELEKQIIKQELGVQ